jgi:DNA-binding NarL/FixJ family response regulator
MMYSPDIVPSQRPQIRLLILENSTFEREGAQSLVRPHVDLEVVGVTAEPAEAFRIAARTPPDVVVVNLQNTDVARVLRELRQRLRAVRYLVMVPSSEPSVWRGLRSAGADELLFGFVRPQAVIEAIRKLGYEAGRA